MSEISTDQHAPPAVYRQWRISAGLTSAVAALLCLSWTLTYQHVAPDMTRTAEQNQRMESQLKTAISRLVAAQDHATVAARQVDVLRRANALLRQSELDRQAELTLLRADLGFYRRLGDASGALPALAVHNIERLATESRNVHRLVFTLTQNLRWASMATGQIRFRLEGTQNDRPVVLSWKDLAQSAICPLEFDFKYFQQLECLIHVPDGFSPIRLMVQLNTDTLDNPVKQSFEWSALGPLTGSRAGVPPSSDN